MRTHSEAEWDDALRECRELADHGGGVLGKRVECFKSELARLVVELGVAGYLRHAFNKDLQLRLEELGGTFGDGDERFKQPMGTVLFSRGNARCHDLNSS